ncbi:uncharacterized protein LOC128350305 isoform X1 [Hemicordylus capensis]|uniref:uncharacterized protein LOC128350305 isoform X1 n=1 Tax=Hemicordylus capensis TaxID=884348 RepID=UPI002304950C|nr:uncharacterized protein LOC128350305 isoform X1 [Hemicordylus capensis]
MPDDLVPGRPAPVAPLPSPEDPAPVLPAPSLPLPAAPVEPPPVDPRVPVAPGAGGAAAPVRVLIYGHSLVFWAFKQTSTSHWGSQLGFGRRALVYWLVMRGMLWSQLLPAIKDHLARFPVPTVLVLHLGENDLGRRTGLSMVQQAASNLTVLRRWMPGVLILWISWLQRRVWRAAFNGFKLEKARRKVSAAIGKLVLAAGGDIIRQPDLAARFHELYRPDGVHLSEAGCDLYLRNIRNGLAALLDGMGQGGQARADLPGWQ